MPQNIKWLQNIKWSKSLLSKNCTFAARLILRASNIYRCAYSPIGSACANSASFSLQSSGLPSTSFAMRFARSSSSWSPFDILSLQQRMLSVHALVQLLKLRTTKHFQCHKSTMLSEGPLSTTIH